MFELITLLFHILYEHFIAPKFWYYNTVSIVTKSLAPIHKFWGCSWIRQLLATSNYYYLTLTKFATSRTIIFISLSSFPFFVDLEICTRDNDKEWQQIFTFELHQPFGKNVGGCKCSKYNWRCSKKKSGNNNKLW